MKVQSNFKQHCDSIDYDFITNYRCSKRPFEPSLQETGEKYCCSQCFICLMLFSFFGLFHGQMLPSIQINASIFPCVSYFYSRFLFPYPTFLLKTLGCGVFIHSFTEKTEIVNLAFFFNENIHFAFFFCTVRPFFLRII